MKTPIAFFIKKKNSSTWTLSSEYDKKINRYYRKKNSLKTCKFLQSRGALGVGSLSPLCTDCPHCSLHLLSVRGWGGAEGISWGKPTRTQYSPRWPQAPECWGCTAASEEGGKTKAPYLTFPSSSHKLTVKPFNPLLTSNGLTQWWFAVAAARARHQPNR